MNTNCKAIFDLLAEDLKAKDFSVNRDDAGEYLSNGSRAFKLGFDEAAKLVSLETAELSEGSGVEWKSISSWMIDDDATEKDIKSISNDFIDSIYELIGAKNTITSTAKVTMPTKKKKADVVDIDALSGRFLSLFPEYKDAYKDNVTKYGDFMPDTFFSEYGVKALTDVIEKSNKKQIKKYAEMLSEAYVNGTEQVTIVIVYSIFATAAANNAKVADAIPGMLTEHKHLLKAVRSINRLLSSEKSKKKYL